MSDLLARPIASIRPFLLTVVIVGMAGCAFGRPPAPAPWMAAVHEYRSNVPGWGPVSGQIEIGPEGPVRVTSSLGPCRLPPSDNYRPWNRARTFVCGTEHRVSVSLGRTGQAPITGTVSNAQTVTHRYQVQTTCRTYQTTPSGVQTCVVWNYEERTEQETTGSTTDFWLVPGAGVTGY